MRIITEIILFLLIFGINCYGQTKKKSNLEVFDETVSAELEKFFYSPGVDREHQFIFMINKDLQSVKNKNDEGTKFLVSTLKKTAGNNKIKYSIAYDTSGFIKDSTENLFLLKPEKFETSYPGFKSNKFLGEKTLIRTITALIDISIYTGGDKFLLTGRININHTDEVNYDKYESLETSPYSFTHGDAPDVSQLESLFFPLMLILTSALATILFFIIRTK